MTHTSVSPSLLLAGETGIYSTVIITVDVELQYCTEESEACTVHTAQSVSSSTPGPALSLTRESLVMISSGLILDRDGELAFAGL